jgi:hypothetical protein
MSIEIKNAKINSTMLGYEDHGIFSFYLNLDYDGSGQSAGGYALDSYIKEKDKRIGTVLGMQLIIEILKTLDIESWEKLKGTYIRVKADYSKVYAIGNLLKDKWLDFEQFFKDNK